MTGGCSLCCPVCDRVLDAGEPCPAHPAAGPPTLTFDADVLREEYNPTETARQDIWRYEAFLPVESNSPVTLGEGGTDLVGADALGSELGVNLSLKREGANPSGSTKDRGSSVLTTYARVAGHGTVACASTGNAAASLAAYAARAGLECSLFVPENIPAAKALQPRAYGADLVTVKGDYSTAYETCQQRVNDQGWLDRSAGATVFPDAGARTLGYELAEQTDRPDWVVVPVGNGGTIAGVGRGLETFQEVGLVPDTPRLLGVQAEGAATIHGAVEEQGSRVTADGSGRNQADRLKKAGSERTCADSIDVTEPHRGESACEVIIESGGTTVTVDDGAIQDSLVRLPRTEGVFAEPASAAGIAGLATAVERGIVDRGDRVVAVITGTGFKDTEAVTDSLE